MLFTYPLTKSRAVFLPPQRSLAPIHFSISENVAFRNASFRIQSMSFSPNLSLYLRLLFERASSPVAKSSNLMLLRRMRSFLATPSFKSWAAMGGELGFQSFSLAWGVLICNIDFVLTTLIGNVESSLIPQGRVNRFFFWNATPFGVLGGYSAFGECWPTPMFSPSWSLNSRLLNGAESARY